MYRIAICEDDEKYIHILQKYIFETNIIPDNYVQFFCYTSGEQLINSLEKDFDLVIMDMQMSGMNGYETARKLREYDKNLLLVFCSGVVEPTSESFKVTPFRYLQKKYSPDIMRRELVEILEEMKERKESPFAMVKCGTHGDRIRIYPEQILYIAIKNETTEVFPCDALRAGCEWVTSFRASKNIDGMWETFNENCGFVRAHNSYIINMAYIAKVHKDSVTLADGTVLTVSRSRSREFKEAFARYVSRKYRGE